MNMARVIARWVDDSLESPLAVDVLIENGRIIGPSLAFGCIDYEGSPRPFVLDEAGRMRFGTGLAWSCDLRESTLYVGTIFRIDFGLGDHGAYRIVKIAVPGSRG